MPHDEIALDGPLLGGARDEVTGLEGPAGRSLFKPGQFTHDLNIADQIRDEVIDWAGGLHQPPSLAWPDDLYVPGLVAYQQYWVLPPAHDHVYQWDWTHSTNPDPNGCSADNGHGYLFSTVNATNLAGRNRATAGLALEYVPTHTLAQVRVSADLSVSGHTKYQTLPHGAHGFLHGELFGTAFLLGWEINPVTGKWEELANSASKTVFAETSWYGLQDTGTTAARAWKGSSFTCDFVVQSGRHYAFGVVFQVTIDMDLRAADDHSPYVRQPDDAIQAWGYLAGNVAQMTVDTNLVNLP
jgi:hypothetical protein